MNDDTREVKSIDLFEISGLLNRNFISATEDIGYYDYRPVTLLFACFISFQRYALS